MFKVLIISFLIPFASHLLFMSNNQEVDYVASTTVSVGSVTTPPQKLTFSDPNQLLTTVSKDVSILGFIPKDIVSLSKLGYPEQSARSVVVSDLERMVDEAKKDGVILSIVSSYRSYDKQVELFSDYSKNIGEVKANTFSARPGHSEHQLGTTFDFSNEKREGLTQGFGLAPEGLWLAKNAYQYGFTISYPTHKVKVTGYTYEPWHYRYVGVEMATYLFKNDLVLQELDFTVYK